MFPGRYGQLGIITCGGSYNTVIRALERQGLADVYGTSEIPIYCLNVAYPLIPDELVEFCVGKQQVLVLEEGQPEYIEHGFRRFFDGGTSRHASLAKTSCLWPVSTLDR